MLIHHQVIFVPFKRPVRGFLVRLLPDGWVCGRNVLQLLGFVQVVLVLLQHFVERLGWLEKGYFVVFLRDHRGIRFFLSLLVVRKGVLVGFDPQLMSVL